MLSSFLIAPTFNIGLTRMIAKGLLITQNTQLMSIVKLDILFASILL